MQSYDLIPAFADPVAQSQQAFRALLSALSEPGSVHHISDIKAAGTLSSAAYAVALTLLDNATTVWLSPAFDQASIRQNLAFHCGCQFVEQPSKAQFAFLTAAELEVFSQLDRGTDRDPEFSATAIVQLADWEGGVERSWSGPGIQTTHLVGLDVAEEFWQLREECNSFPRGIDVLFIAKNEVIGLPRTTQVA